MGENREKKIVQDDEIDLIELFKVVWSARVFIVKITSAFLVLGLLIAFTSRVEYEASCKLLSENQDGIKSNLGGLGGLAGLAGINLDMNTQGALSPQLYPQIANSVPFQLDLIHSNVYFGKISDSVTAYYYFSEVQNQTFFELLHDYTVGLPYKLKNLFVSTDSSEIATSDILVLTQNEWNLLEQFRKRLSVSIDEETGIISISAKMPDAFAAAQLTNLVVTELTDRITNYKTDKYIQNKDFVKERFEESKREYEIKQEQLANFIDRNKNITSSVIQAETQRLQNELNIAFEVYKGLATQLEQAKIKVKEETPVFTVLEPVRVPEEKSSPKRGQIMILSAFIGVFISLIYILIQNRFVKNLG